MTLFTEITSHPALERSSRLILHLPISMAPPHLPRPKRWPPCSTSTSASTRWVGVLCHGSTSPISSQRGRGLMVLLRLVRVSGYGVRMSRLAYRRHRLQDADPSSQTLSCPRPRHKFIPTSVTRCSSCSVLSTSVPWLPSLCECSDRVSFLPYGMCH